jgi:hypothetical protein
MKSDASSQHNFVFWVHLLLIALAWTGPFLFRWQLLLPPYLFVILQFWFFKKCFMNDAHQLSEGDDTTLYSYAFEKMGWQVNRKRLKFLVRNVFYPFLAAFTLLWQLGLGFKPLIY